MRLSLGAGFVALMLAPYAIWFSVINEWSPIEPAYLNSAIGNSLLQAGLSAGFSVLVGLVLTFSILSESGVKRIHFFEAALLLPNLLPPLVIILSFLSWSKWIGFYPYGMWSVVLVHVLLNAGLVAVSLNRVIRTKALRLAEVAWVLGSNRRTIVWRVVLPVVKRELWILFVFVFGLCLTSFSLPLLLAETRSVSLEVAIFDTIRMRGNWSQALFLAAVQALLLLFLALKMPRLVTSQNIKDSGGSGPLGFSQLKILVFLPALFLVGGWMAGLSGGKLVVPKDFLPSALMSLSIGLGVGGLHLLLFLILVYLVPLGFVGRFLNGYLAPSPALIGFGFLLLPLSSEPWAFLKLILALTLISLPLLYRWLLHGAFENLANQVEVARVLGASSRQIGNEIVWPQVLNPLLKCCGLAAIWASGDFALSSIFLRGPSTLPLLIQDLIQSYQIEMAMWLMIPLMVIGILCYFFFVGAGRYVRG